MARVSGQSSFEGLLVDWVVDHATTPSRLPVGLLSREQKAAELQRLQAEKAMRAAYEAELILGLAAETPDITADHPAAAKGSWAPDGELPGVAESFTHELSMILNCGRGSASVQAARAWAYRENLPATWARLAAGSLDEPRAKALVDVLEHAAPEVARWVEAKVLPEAAGLSIGKLKKRALELLIQRDAEAIDERRKRAQREADVRVYPSPRDGMSTLAADLPTPVAAECFDLVDQLAAMLKADGDPRPIGQLRAEVLADLLRRPWDTTRPGISARLTLFATLGSLSGRSSEPGEVNGLPITASALRDLLVRLHALRTDHRLHVPAGATVALTDPDGALRAPHSASSSWRASPSAAAPSTLPATAAAPCWTDHRRPMPTPPRPPNAAGSRRGTAPAGSPTAGNGWAGPTWTTSSPTPPAGKPTAATCAVCAVATTG